MATITADAPARLTRRRGPRIRPRAGSGRIGSPTTPRPWATGVREQLVIVDFATRQPVQLLRSARISRVSRRLNGIGQIDFTMSSWDRKILSLVDMSTWDGASAELALLGHEWQYWRDGMIWSAGPVVIADPNLNGTVSFTGYDYGWYLSRRAFGGGERKDLLNGIGQMETPGLPGWTRHGITPVRDTSTRARGTSSARLSGSGAISASFPHPPQAVGQDMTVLITAEVKIPAGTPVGTRILSAAAVPAGESEPYRVSTENEFVTTADTKLGAFTRITCRVFMKPNVENRIDLALWSMGPDIWFDDVRALRNDTTGIPAPGKDLTAHGIAMMEHAQSTTRGQGSFGLGINVLHPSGTVEPLGIRHLEHTQLLDLFESYTQREDGWDWWIDFPTRTVWFSKRKGVDHTNLVLHNRNVSTGGWNHDESKRSSKCLVLGDADGVDRPEGVYVDASSMGGLVLDDVYKPANGTPLSALDPMARARHATLSKPQVNPNALTVSDKYLDVLDTGDRVPVQLRSGYLRMAASTIRIGELAINRDLGVLELA